MLLDEHNYIIELQYSNFRYSDSKNSFPSFRYCSPIKNKKSLISSLAYVVYNYITNHFIILVSTISFFGAHEHFITVKPKEDPINEDPHWLLHRKKLFQAFWWWWQIVSRWWGQIFIGEFWSWKASCSCYKSIN